MKKLILVSMLAIGMSVFAEKFTPSNKTLEISLKEVLEGATPNGYYWMDGSFDNNKYPERYSFFIMEDNKGKIDELIQGYEIGKKTGGEIREKIYDDIDDDSTVYGSYKIYSAGKKGVYYVNNYVALDGKKHARLYFGFDKKQNTVVILDKNLNVIEVLQRVAVN